MRLIHHVRTVMAEFYDQGLLKGWAEDLQTTIYDAVDDDPNKPFDMGDFVDNLDNNMWWFTTEIAGIVETIDNRRPYLESHPEILKVPPTILAVSQNIAEPSSTDIVYVMAEVSNADDVYLRVTNDDAPYASDFPQITMVDDGTGGDATAADGIYTAQVPYTTSQDHIKYYIEATNADAMALMPERAEFYYYHYYVDEVVSISEPTLEMSVYPNPTVDFVNVQFDGEAKSIQLFNLNGQVVYQEFNVLGPISQIDLSKVEAGTYLLAIETESGSAVEKLIIR